MLTTYALLTCVFDHMERCGLRNGMSMIMSVPLVWSHLGRHWSENTRSLDPPETTTKLQLQAKKMVWWRHGGEGRGSWRVDIYWKIHKYTHRTRLTSLESEKVAENTAMTSSIPTETDVSLLALALTSITITTSGAHRLINIDKWRQKRAIKRGHNSSSV